MQKLFYSIAALLTLTIAGYGQQIDTPLGPIIENFKIEAVGIYKGDVTLGNVKLDDSGHTVRQAEVIVNSPEQPVVLVLTAYDPTIWRVGRTKGTEIAGIMVSGYHGQALIGPEKSIPVQISAYKKKGEFKSFWADSANRKLLKMNNQLTKMFGREISRFHIRADVVDGKFYVGEQPELGDVLYSDDYTLEEYKIDENKPAELNQPGARPLSASQIALNKLVAEGKLRLATSVEIKAWITKASEPFKRFNPKLQVKPHMSVGRTYVVLAECELPNGLHGAHSRSFIIPLNTPTPGGPKCHNSFYLMNGKKAGVAAMADR